LSGVRTNIRFERQPVLHDLVTCPECGTELEVIKLSPLKLDWAYDDEDDDWLTMMNLATMIGMTMMTGMTRSGKMKKTKIWNSSGFGNQ
jgi:lysine biosynthesis protein LysW